MLLYVANGFGFHGGLGFLGIKRPVITGIALYNGRHVALLAFELLRQHTAHRRFMRFLAFHALHAVAICGLLDAPG